MNHSQVEKTRLVESLRALVKGRWFYIGAIALTGIISKIFGTSVVELPIGTMVYITIFGLLMQLALTLFLKFHEKLSIRFLKLTNIGFVVLESIIFTFILFYAGGYSSGAFMYYFFAIILSAFLYPLRGVVLVATYISLLYCFLSFAQCFGYIPILSSYNLEFEYEISTNLSIVVVNALMAVSTFYIVGLFAGLLANAIRKMERTIMIEKDKSRVIIENFVDGLIYINKSNIVEIVNPRAEKLLNIRAGEVVGRKIVDINAQETPVLFQVVHLSGKGNLVPLGKSELYYTVNEIKITDPKDGEVGEIRIIHDNSREKFVDRIKSEFITIASHQLRTPLSAIKGAVDMLKNGDFGKVDDEQKKILSKTGEYTDNLIGIVNDLLNISSIEHGQSVYEFKKIDLHFLLRDSVERFMSQMQKKGLVVNLSIGDNEEEIEIDPYKMKLAIGSLIDNAISYSPKGGKIEIRGKVGGGQAEIMISDNGIGIPIEEKGKVFTKFFRAMNSLKVKTEGNGLDLYVAKTIVENHHGRIWFESKEGFGTSFYIQIPTVQPNSP